MQRLDQNPVDMEFPKLDFEILQGFVLLLEHGLDAGSLIVLGEIFLLLLIVNMNAVARLKMLILLNVLYWLRNC